MTDKLPAKEATRFATAISALVVTFGKEASEAVFEGYRIGLEGVPIEAVEYAVARALRECKFMPLPAELRELAGILSPADRAILAWGAFTKAVPAHGYHHSVDFDDRLINATVRNLGGWMAVCSIDDAKEFDVWLRKRFIETYRALASTGVDEASTAPLLGYYEQQNVLHGYGDQVRPPVLIETGLPPHGAGILPIGHERKERPAIEYAGDIGKLPKTT